MEKTVSEIAVLVGGRAGGDTGRIIKSLAALDEAGVNDLAFAVPPHIDEARATLALKRAIARLQTAKAAMPGA